MKKKDIITLVNGGILRATAHSLPVEHFYKWHKFRRELDREYRHIDEEQASLLQECGIVPGRINEASEEELLRFNEANRQLLDDDVTLNLPAPIPTEYYKGIYDENREVDLGNGKVDVFASLPVETIVLETLFVDNINAE